MYKHLCMWLCVSTCLVMQLCLACETSPAACVSSPGCADPPLHLSSLSVPLLPSHPLLQKVLRSCSVPGILSDKPRHSQHGRCPFYTSPPFHRREGRGSERGNCLPQEVAEPEPGP